jgi:kinesin family protein C1
MIPRAVEQVFKYSQKMKAKGWTYSLTASFVEIYNEQIRDLLNNSESYQDCPQTFQDGGKCRHEIRNVDGYTILTGVTEVPVDNAQTVQTLLNLSARNRKSSMTAMNDRASRSHSVFSLKIVGTHEGSAQQALGVLNLVDLAGSERLGLSGAEGDRMKETAHINKSLSCLGDVIVSLAKGDNHVPFRNSKLTHMLQPYMGNESKTLMFVNVSPSELFLNETLNSLRFAAKVNACEIGLAKKKISSKAK